MYQYLTGRMDKVKRKDREGGGAGQLLRYGAEDDQAESSPDSNPSAKMVVVLEAPSLLALT